MIAVQHASVFPNLAQRILSVHNRISRFNPVYLPTGFNGRNAMSKDKWWSVAKGGLLALSGCVVAWLASDVIPQIDQSNAGGMLAAAAVSVAINLLRKYREDSGAK